MLYNNGNDRYSTTYTGPDFRHVNLEGYSGDSTAMLEYLPQSDTTITGYVKGHLTLSPGEYSVQFEYAATDGTSVLKIYASDYVSADNSGGIVLLQQPLDPNLSSVRSGFSLDQRVDNLVILVETQDSGLQIGRVTTRSSGPVCTDTYFSMAVTLLLAFGAVYLLNLKKTSTAPALLNKHEVPGVNTLQALVFIMGVAVAIASLPMLSGGILTGHDLPFHMARIDGMASGLQSGQFPVRVHGEMLNNYGYPNSMFYPELLMYLPALLRLLGVSTFTCYKFYVVMVNGLTMVFAYVAFKKLSNSRTVGLAAGVIYLLAPYRLICAYFRSAIGEFTALTFLPLALYGLYAILYGNKKDWLYLVIGATGILQSHILTTEMVILLAAIFCIIGIRQLFGREKRIFQMLCAAAATLLLNLWLLGPMLLMMSQLGLSVFGRPMGVQGLDASFNFLRLFTVGTLNVAGPHPVGWVTLFTGGAYILYRIIYGKNNNHSKLFFRVGDILALLTVVFTIATTSYFPWSLVERIPVLGTLMASLQFPYRLLAIAQVCAAALFVFTILAWCSTKKAVTMASVVVVSVSIVTTLLLYEFGFVRVDAELINDKSYYQGNMANSLSVGQAEYLVEGSNLDDMIAKTPVIESSAPALTVANLKHNGTTMSFEYTVNLAEDGQTMLVLPITYIPNYVIEVDGVRVAPEKYEGGRVAFAAPKSQGAVTVRYVEPFTFRGFELISLLTLVCLALYAKGIVPPFKFLLRRKKTNE